jgi:hypothetical protein
VADDETLRLEAPTESIKEQWMTTLDDLSRRQVRGFAFSASLGLRPWRQIESHPLCSLQAALLCELVRPSLAACGKCASSRAGTSMLEGPRRPSRSRISRWQECTGQLPGAQKAENLSHGPFALQAEAKVQRKMGYTRKKLHDLEERKKEAERRKAEVLKTCGSGGMKHTAAAMMNRR